MKIENYEDCVTMWQVIKDNDDVQNTYHFIFSLNIVKLMKTKEELADIMTLSTFTNEELQIAAIIDEYLEKLFASSCRVEAKMIFRKFLARLQVLCGENTYISDNSLERFPEEVPPTLRLDRAVTGISHGMVEVRDKPIKLIALFVWMAYYLREEVPFILDITQYNNTDLEYRDSIKFLLLKSVKWSTNRIYHMCKI